MKHHLTLNQLAAELTRHEQDKRDFVASTEAMRVDFTNQDAKCIEIGSRVDESFELTAHAHRQLSTRLGIP